eukprot:gene10665-11794_t
MACYESLLSCARASIGNFELALQRADIALRYLSDILPNGHTVLAVANNLTAILQAANKQTESATLQIDIALHILSKTTDSDEETCKQTFLWIWAFVTLLDHPFSWIGYPPCANAVVLGADYQYHSEENQDSQVPKALRVQDTDISKVWYFCKHQSKYQPELSLVANYLFEEGLSALGLLEAQKFGDFDLDMLFTKLIVSLKFTTRGINYGPALCYHIRDMHSLRPHEECGIRNLWVSNKSSKPGHCRPQDQSLEAQFNNSAKNCFKLGTVENVSNKASMIQERELCHKNLKDELSVNKHKVKPSIHQFKADSFIHLRACWRKGLNEIFKDLTKGVVNESNLITLTSMHSKNIIVNPELLNVRKIGEDRVNRFVSVKIAQVDGWQLQTPTFSEVLTVPRAITARQQKAALNHANQQVEVMSRLLLQATGMQVSLSEDCKPIQLLKKDGKSLQLAKKSDLTSWLYKNYESAFLNETLFDKETDSLNNVTCMIRDCMFDFRHLKIPTCTYEDMSSLIIDQTVIARKFANRNRHFTFIQTFDRRADQTKGCTEVTRASVRISPFSGHCGIFAAYTVDVIGNVYLSNNDYGCYHPEADTVVFFALKRFLDQNPNVHNNSIIIKCPEADNVTILLLEHYLINDIINDYAIKLFCAIHNKLVNVKTGKPTKKPKKDANVEEFRDMSSKVKMNFYIDVKRLYATLSASECFKNTRFAIESLGALSIYTGNDKNPGIRHITKCLALTVYSQACKDGILSSLGDAQGKLSDTESCKHSFLMLYARIYFHIYRVYIRQLANISWDTINANAGPNLKLLRDIGYQYAKGQLEKVPPVDGALDEIFARALFQASEYDQIFESNISYLDPLDFGFEVCKGGLKPKLNRNAPQTSKLGSHIVMSEVDKMLLCQEPDIGDRDYPDTPSASNIVFPEDSFSDAVDADDMHLQVDMTGESILNITLGQMDISDINEIDV